MTNFVSIKLDGAPETVVINLDHVKMMVDSKKGAWIEFIDGKKIQSTISVVEIMAMRT